MRNIDEDMFSEFYNDLKEEYLRINSSKFKTGRPGVQAGNQNK